jgi:hypothetical protein
MENGIRLVVMQQHAEPLPYRNITLPRYSKETGDMNWADENYALLAPKDIIPRKK